MQIPSKMPAKRWATLLFTLYAAAWISLEGSLGRVVVMGVATTAVSLLHLGHRYLGGKTLARGQWLLATTGAGLLLGLGSGVLTLVFMAVKTGLHAHGPEFTPQEIAWVGRQLPLWTAVGAIAGLGLGLLTISE